MTQSTDERQYCKIVVALTIPEDMMRDIYAMSDSISMDVTEIYSGFTPKDFIANDYASMLADGMTEHFLNQPGHLAAAQEYYYDNLREMFESVKIKDPDYSMRKADDYIGLAQKFVGEVISGGQLEPVRKHFDAINKQQHITCLMPAERVVHSENGTFIVAYEY